VNFHNYNGAYKTLNACPECDDSISEKAQKEGNNCEKLGVFLKSDVDNVD